MAGRFTVPKSFGPPLFSSAKTCSPTIGRDWSRVGVCRAVERRCFISRPCGFCEAISSTAVVSQTFLQWKSWDGADETRRQRKVCLRVRGSGTCRPCSAPRSNRRGDKACARASLADDRTSSVGNRSRTREREAGQYWLSLVPHVTYISHLSSMTLQQPLLSSSSSCSCTYSYLSLKLLRTKILSVVNFKIKNNM